MKRKVVTTVVILSLALAFSGLCGCGKKAEDAPADQVMEDPEEGRGDLITDEEQFADPEEEPAEEPAEEPEGDGDAAEAEGSDSGYGVYLDKINELKSEGLADQFTLAYINDDGSDTPELIASDSTGSFEHENAFIFTVANGEVVEVASVIAGVDGANLDYAIGANLIHISGAAAGMRDVFSRIENGKLEEVFTAEASSMDEDAKYTINGSNVKEEEYYEQINAFVEPYNPLVRIAYDGLYEVEYTYKDGYGGFEQGSSEKYSLTD